ncbi:hypothetical protein [Halomonas sp. WWR20]
MSDFDNLAKKLARAKAKYDALADRAIKGDPKVFDEIVEALQAYTDSSIAQSDDAATSPGAEAPHEPAREPPRANLDKTLTEYRHTKDRIEAIVDRHMQAAFREIEQQFGATPTSVSLKVLERHEMQGRYPNGKYAGCRVSLGGEPAPGDDANSKA